VRSVLKKIARAGIKAKSVRFDEKKRIETPTDVGRMIESAEVRVPVER
jgi:hypothetical protein